MSTKTGRTLTPSSSRRCRWRPRSSPSARWPAAGWSGRAAPRPRSAPASSPAPATSSTAAAAAGRASRGARRVPRDRKGRPARRERRVRRESQERASNRRRRPRSSSATSRRRVSKRHAGQARSRAARKAQAQLSTDGVWAFCVLPRPGRRVDLDSRTAFTPKGVSHLDVPAGKYVIFAKADGSLGRQRRARIRRLHSRRGHRLGHLRQQRRQHFLALTVVHAFAEPARIALRCVGLDSLSGT